MIQAAICWGLLKPFTGIEPARRLKSLIIQAENDEEDLAEMRDGLFDEMALTPEERELADKNVLVVTDAGRSGDSFFHEVLVPLLEQHKPVDLVWIDPALSYLGGDSNAQVDVGHFLRQGLNPLLHKYGCGAIVILHEGKPPREPVAQKRATYTYAGSAEWANWARAQLSLQETKPGEFTLTAGKRGNRLKWEPIGDTGTTRHLRHSRKEGVICWQEVPVMDLVESEGPHQEDGRAPLGRPPKQRAGDLLELLPEDGLTSTKWQKRANEERGISRRSFFELKKQLEADGAIEQEAKSKKWRAV
jgi:hypothetical protein